MPSANTHIPPVSALAIVPGDTDAYLSLRQLTAYSGMSLRSLRRALSNRSHPLPHCRLGSRKVLVRRTEFDRWMRHFHHVPTPVDLAQMIEETLRGLRS